MQPITPHKGQQAIIARMNELLREVGQPYGDRERGTLINLLREVNRETLCGEAINDTFEKGLCVDTLIEGLAQQAADDFITMIGIVGHHATILLLRSLHKTT